LLQLSDDNDMTLSLDRRAEEDFPFYGILQTEPDGYSDPASAMLFVMGILILNVSCLKGGSEKS
jgi:hypothetical protein